MKTVLVRPAGLSCDHAATWAWYGATQALGMLGLTYEEMRAGADIPEALAAHAPDRQPPTLILDPARGQVCLNCLPEGEADEATTAEVATVTHQACFARPDGGPRQALPVCGPPRVPVEGVPVGEVVALAGETPALPLMTVTQDGLACRVHFTGRVFETIGLYLSRFSWPGDPGFKTFVREIDDLWDGALRERWGQTAVVNDYLQVIAGLLCQLCAQVGEPLVTVWPHPFRDGQVKRQGFLVSHDVDQLFADPAMRGQLDQSSNPRWFLPRWREFESELNVRSAHYFYSPKPGEKYWFEPNYSPTDPAVLAEMKTLMAGGWEVSLHQMSHESEAEVRGEVEFLLEVLGNAWAGTSWTGQEPSGTSWTGDETGRSRMSRPTRLPTGTRSHYLKHTFDTLAYKVAAGLRYDSTWYAEQTTSGLLCGSLLPYRPLDCRTAQPLDLWEFPFVIEDGNVFGVYGQGTGRDIAGAIADGEPILDLALAHDGFVCFNWHQQTFSQMGSYPGVADCWPPAMAGLIRYLRGHSKSTWNPLPIELADWCSRREAVQVSMAEGKVRLHNAGNTECPDLVLCFHMPTAEVCPLEAIGCEVPAEAQYLGQQGSRSLYALPVAVDAQATVVIDMPQE